MTEMRSAMRMLAGDFPTCIQRINYPFHKGKPNPEHGRFYFVGSIPADCYDREKKTSKHYDTEEEAIAAARSAGAVRIQASDCRFV